jgi:hypothetical protein
MVREGTRCGADAADTPEAVHAAGVSLPLRPTTREHACGAPAPKRRRRSPSSSRVPGDAVAVRDRVVLGALLGGAVAAVLLWRVGGPVPSLLVVVLAVLVACAAYRVEAPRIDLTGTPWLDGEGAPAEQEARAAERAEPVDQ